MLSTSPSLRSYAVFFSRFLLSLFLIGCSSCESIFLDLEIDCGYVHFYVAKRVDIRTDPLSRKNDVSTITFPDSIYRIDLDVLLAPKHCNYNRHYYTYPKETFFNVFEITIRSCFG
jgi:hypothetical protein